MSDSSNYETRRKKNKYTEYAAEMTILLAYHKGIDDWKDEHKPEKLIYAVSLKKAYLQIIQKYPEKSERIEELLEELSVCEKNKEKNIDYVAGLFGKITAEIFWVEEDIFKEHLTKMGFYMGKFIYLMDAYEDMEKDKKKNNYNILLFYEEQEQFETYCKNILRMMMAECSKAFEKLPIIENIDILRNIIYAGVWTKYEIIQKKEKKQYDGSI